MPGFSIDDLVLLVAAGALALGILGEIVFLTRSGWATAAKAAAFALITDLVWLVFAVLFAVLMTMFGLMLVYGPDGRGGTAPDISYIVLAMAAVIVPPVFLCLFKSAALALLKIRSGLSAWAYSFASAMLLTAGVFLLPALLYAAVNWMQP